MCTVLAGLLTDEAPVLLVSRLVPLRQWVLEVRGLRRSRLLSLRHRGCGNGCSGTGGRWGGGARGVRFRFRGASSRGQTLSRHLTSGRLRGACVRPLHLLPHLRAPSSSLFATPGGSHEPSLSRLKSKSPKPLILSEPKNSSRPPPNKSVQRLCREPWPRASPSRPSDVTSGLQLPWQQRQDSSPPSLRSFIFFSSFPSHLHFSSRRPAPLLVTAATKKLRRRSLLQPAAISPFRKRQAHSAPPCGAQPRHFIPGHAAAEVSAWL